MIRLFLNGEEVDILQKNFRQTKQVSNIGDIGNRRGNYTNIFECPMTSNNLNIFDQLGIPGNISDAAYQRPTAVVYDEGIEVISEGYAVVIDIDQNYNIAIYDGNITLPEILGDQTLRDLDYSAHNHDLSASTYINSLDNTSGYIYGYARYDYQVNRPFMYLNTSSPSIFLHTLWDMIFEANGITYSGAIFTDTNFLNKVIPVGEGFEQDINSSISNVTQGSDNDSSVDVDEFSPNAVAFTYIAAVTGSYILSVDSDVSTIYDIEVEFRVTRNGGVPYSESQIDFPSISETYNIALTAGDTLTIEYFATSNDPQEPNQTYSYDVDWDLDIIDTYNPIVFEDIMPDTRQIDFLKTIFQAYGLVFQKTSERHFEFIQMEVLLRDRDNAEDWSALFSRTIRQEFIDSKYGRTSYIDYSYNGNYNVNENNYARGSISVNNANIDIEKTLFTSSITATSQDLDNPEFQSGNPLMQLFHFEVDDNDTVPSEDVLRFLEIQVVQMQIAVGFSGEDGIQYSGDIPLLRQPTWSELITDNYTALEEMMNRYHKLTVMMDISPVEFLNINFMTLKYIQQLGDYFYLNKVSNYQAGKLTKIELIRTKAEPI